MLHSRALLELRQDLRLVPKTCALTELHLLSTRERPQQSRMWTPRRGGQQLDLLCHHERPELRGKAFHEVLAGEDPCPVLAPVGIVIKLPEVDELVDGAGVGLKVAHELLVMAALV